MTQVVDHMLCKCEALSSNPNPTKKSNKNKRVVRKGGRYGRKGEEYME
jgi:hypothetical protein